jgi:PAS domain S-box-containing protein
MKADSFKQQFQIEQVEALYGGTVSTVLTTLSIATIIYFTIASELTGIQSPALWIFVIYAVSIMRGIDAYLFFKADKSKRNYKQYLGRFAVGAISAAISWSLMLWNYFPASPQESQFYLMFFLLGIASFATTSLSYHLGISLVFLIALILPIEIQLLLNSSSFYSVMSLLTPIFFLAQTNGVKRINRRYLENIRIQSELKEKEKQYKDLEYAVDQHSIVSVVDVKGNIIYANDKTSQISKYSIDELIGRNHLMLSSGEHSASFWEKMWRSVSLGNVWHGKIKNKDKNGKPYWLDSSIVPFMDENGKPYQYISISTDITKLKELEQQSLYDKNDALIRAKISHVLHEQSSLKERMEKSLEVMARNLNLNLGNDLGVLFSPGGGKKLIPFATYSKSGKTARLKNKCIVNMLMLCDEAISSGNLMVSDDCSLESHSGHSHEKNPHGHYIIPLLHNTRVLGILFLQTAPSPTRNPIRLNTLRFIGNLFGMAFANETIKANLHKARRHAVELAQTKSDFLANMSHEIRTPMNGVLGMLDLLKTMPLDTLSKNYVDTAQSSASMLLNVINDILDISKIESGKLHIERISFDLRKAVEDTTELLSKLAHEKNIELLTFIPPDTKVFIEGDMLRLQQVINNLMSNAIKFTHEGEVSISISMVKETEHTVRLRFEVKDTGIGIPASKQATLFKAFTQADTSTSREYGGTGLGLAISKKLIEMMGGEIGLISKAGAGSTFWFELPFKTVHQHNISYNSLDKLRVLTVDDNATNCMILDKYIQSWGAESSVVNSAEAGLSQLLEASKKGQGFDVLLLDMQMPGLTGKDVATTIRNNPTLRKLKIILLSSMGLNSKMNGDGLFDLMLNKPIRQSQLYDAIVTVKNKKLIHNCTSDSNNDNDKPDNPEKSAPQQLKQQLKGKILFVDDSRVNQYVGNEYLTRLGLDFEIVSNGLEAVKQRKEGDFDLILMDCQMPVMDGYKATGEIRKYENESGADHMTIVALTANAMQGDREKCIDAGMDDYLTKPYTVEMLHKSLSAWLPVEELDPV